MYEVQLLHQEPVVRRQMDLLVKPPVRPRQRRGVLQQGAVILDHVGQNLTSSSVACRAASRAASPSSSVRTT